jgi:hypothetical protein
MIVALIALLIAQNASASQSTSNFLLANQQDPVMAATLRDFSRCVAKRDAERTFAFLKTGQFAIPANPDVRALVAANDGCLANGVSLTFNQIFFAGDAAEDFYSRNHFLFAEHPLKPAAVQALTTLGSTAVVGAGCVAELQPHEVDALLSSPIGSEEEAHAALALRQSLEACLPRVPPAPERIRAVIAAGAFPAVASSMKAVP